MSVPTGVDGDAPVRADHETDISAPLDTIWQLHADVNAWPAWQTDITTAHIDGAFQPGASFEWTGYGFTVSTIYAVAERSRRMITRCVTPSGIGTFGSSGFGRLSGRIALLSKVGGTVTICPGVAGAGRQRASAGVSR